METEIKVGKAWVPGKGWVNAVMHNGVIYVQVQGSYGGPTTSAPAEAGARFVSKGEHLDIEAALQEQEAVR